MAQHTRPQPSRAWRAGVVAGVLGVLLLPAAAAAHPLGNFTVNRAAAVVVAADRVRVDYLVDMAEIPAFQARQEIDRDGDQRIVPAEAAGWRAATCARLAAGLRLRLDGWPLALGVGGSRLWFPPGAGGLPTLRLACALAAPVAAVAVGAGDHTLTLADANGDGRVGWREITAAGDGATVTGSDVPAASPSQGLTRYPQELLRSPLDQRSATVRFRAGGARPAGAARAAREGGVALPLGVDRATGAFAGLVARTRLSLALALAAVGVALALGALHALAPGHGKTVMAAYLVGLRGSLRQALGIGLTVTATHTAGVLLLGVALSASRTLAPERVYPWLGLASGLLLVAVGVALLGRALRGGHPHPHDHPHRQIPAHPHPHDHAAAGRPPGRRALVAMGFAGGLVPSPSALVVLVGAGALGRVWFGVLLVTAYGAGMAATLTGAGMLLARARGLLDRRAAGGGHGRLARLGRGLPVATAAVIVLVGLTLATRGALGV